MAGRGGPRRGARDGQDRGAQGSRDRLSLPRRDRGHRRGRFQQVFRPEDGDRGVRAAGGRGELAGPQAHRPIPREQHRPHLGVRERRCALRLARPGGELRREGAQERLHHPVRLEDERGHPLEVLQRHPRPLGDGRVRLDGQRGPVRDPRAGGRVDGEGHLRNVGVAMSESATELAGPSLEDILWRTMDRFAEEPAVLDAEEFAARIAGAFDGELPEEAFVERFVEGNPELARKADMAEAIVRSTPARLHVYQFDLGHLDYVVIEEEEQVVVVSDFGQFALTNDRPAQQAIASAVVRDRSGLERRAVDRASSEPRAYLVRQDGDLVVLDVQKLAAAIARLPVKQVSAPAVVRPPVRLLPFEPRVRRLTARSEERALRENDRLLSMPVPPRARTSGLDDGPIADARPSTAAPAVLVLLPGGSVAVSGTQRFTVQAGKVSAVFTGGESRLAPGAVGGTAAARGDGVVAARADFAPVRVLGDDELAQAVAAGAARIVAGWAAPISLGAETRDRYWVQPETVFAPTREDRELVARSDPSAGLDAPSGPQVAAGEPLQLGQITGDPWADWALQVGRSGEAAPLAARALRERFPREIRLRGEPVVAFRAPDGTLVLNGERGPIRR